MGYGLTFAGIVAAPAIGEAGSIALNRVFFGPLTNRVFWSGVGYFGARAYALANEGSTLEMTPVGRLLDSVTRNVENEGFGFNYTTIRPAWQAASRLFAAGSRGPVTMSPGVNGYMGPTFLNYELPALLGRVTYMVP